MTTGPRPRAGTRLRRSWRRLALAAGALVVVSGCAAGFDAQTNQPYQPADGVTVRHGSMYVLDALVVTNGHGHGTVVAALVNQSGATDSLTTLTMVDAHGHTVVAKIHGSKVTVPGHSANQLADTGAVRVSDPNLHAGDLVTLNFTFQTAQPVKVQVPVMARSGSYATVPVA